MTCASESNLIVYTELTLSGANISIYNIFLQTFFIIFLTRLRVGLIHLRDHKLRHYFRDSLNPICNCGNAIESIKHYFLHHLNFKNERQSLLQNVRTINSNLLFANQEALSLLLLHGDTTFTYNTNTVIIVILLNPVTVVFKIL